MNRTEMNQCNEESIADLDFLIDKLKKKKNIVYINSVIVATGLSDTVKQIMAGADVEYGTGRLTPYQRAIFSWAYLEILSGFINYSLQANSMPEGISIIKQGED